MSNCYVLLPGARLDRGSFERLSSDSRALLERFGKGVETVKFQTLVDDVHAHAAHYVWLWRVLGQKSNFPPIAPLLWRSFDAPHLSEAMALLTPFTEKEGRIEPVRFEELEFLRVFDVLRRVAQEKGLRLQSWDGRLFLTGPEDFAFDATPAPVLSGLPARKRRIEGNGAEKAEAFLKAAEEALRPILEVRLHLSDAGRANFRLRPSTIRALWTDDPIVRGLAVAAGLRPDTIGTLSRPMPPSPPGDAVVVFDDLFTPTRTGDIEAWEDALSKVLERWNDLLKLKSRFDRFIPIAFGCTASATLLPPESGLLSLFKRPSVQPEAWCVDGSEAA